MQAAQDEALSAALSDAGFGLQFADVAVDSTGKVFGSCLLYTSRWCFRRAGYRRCAASCEH